MACARSQMGCSAWRRVSLLLALPLPIDSCASSYEHCMLPLPHLYLQSLRVCTRDALWISWRLIALLACNLLRCVPGAHRVHVRAWFSVQATRKALPASIHAQPTYSPIAALHSSYHGHYHYNYGTEQPYRRQPGTPATSCSGHHDHDHSHEQQCCRTPSTNSDQLRGL